jgi:toxin ParE1/3/4
VKTLIVAGWARADLDAIARYTERRWGIARKRLYLDMLRRRFADLRTASGLGAARDDIRPGYRSIMCGSHIVFYRETADRIEILRVLHQRMDLHGRFGIGNDENP